MEDICSYERLFCRDEVVSGVNERCTKGRMARKMNWKGCVRGGRSRKGPNLDALYNVAGRCSAPGVDGRSAVFMHLIMRRGNQ
jgi:hypothetical protein